MQFSGGRTGRTDGTDGTDGTHGTEGPRIVSHRNINATFWAPAQGNIRITEHPGNLDDPPTFLRELQTSPRSYT